MRSTVLAANETVSGCIGEVLSFAQVSGDVKSECNHLAKEPDVFGPVLALLLRRCGLKVPDYPCAHACAQQMLSAQAYAESASPSHWRHRYHNCMPGWRSKA